jgi:hypothetical protein
MSNFGDSTLIYIQVTANKLGKLCELKISSFHSIQVAMRPSEESKKFDLSCILLCCICAISANSENMADPGEYKTRYIYWQTFCIF